MPKKGFRQRPRSSKKKKPPEPEVKKPEKKFVPPVAWGDIIKFTEDIVEYATAIAIDPGNKVSGWIAYHAHEHPNPDEPGGIHIAKHGVWSNKYLRKLLNLLRNEWAVRDGYVAIEKPFASGMLASNELFDTCMEIGRFKQTWLNDKTFHEVNRRDVKLHICGQARAKDPNVRQALIDRFGGKDKAFGGIKCKKCKGKGWAGRGRPTCDECDGDKWEHPPGPLFGVASHVWAALGIACLMADANAGRV